MPQVLIPLVVGVASSVAGGFITKAMTPKPPSMSSLAPTQQLGQSAADKAREELQTRMAKARQIRNQLPNLQEAVGGSVSPEYYATVAAMLSGNPGENDVAMDAVNNWMGLDTSNMFGSLVGDGMSGGPGGSGFGGGPFEGGVGMGGDYFGGPSNRGDLYNGSFDTNWSRLGEFGIGFEL